MQEKNQSSHMNFPRSCDTRVHRHSSFPSHHQWFSPYRKNNTPLSQVHENQRRHQACLGGSSQTSLPSVSRTPQKLTDSRFAVWFSPHHSSLQQERGFARFVRRVQRALALPAPGPGCLRLLRVGTRQADIVCTPHATSLAHRRLTPQPLPRHASFGDNPGGAHIHTSAGHRSLPRDEHPGCPGVGGAGTRAGR